MNAPAWWKRGINLKRGMVMKLKTLCVAAGLLTALSPMTADAALINFDVLYYGAGVSALAPGSDNLLTTTAVTGDTIHYQFTAAGSGSGWMVINNGQVFGLGNLLATPVSGVFDYVMRLKLGGVTQASQAQTGTSQCCADLGARFVTVTTGAKFDQITLDVILQSGFGTPVQFLGLAPAWPDQAPEINRPDLFTFVPGILTSVPEPASWALLLAGFGLGGALMRRRPNVRVSFV
jgi:hypothetical protein